MKGRMTMAKRAKKKPVVEQVKNEPGIDVTLDFKASVEYDEDALLKLLLADARKRIPAVLQHVMPKIEGTIVGDAPNKLSHLTLLFEADEVSI